MQDVVTCSFNFGWSDGKFEFQMRDIGKTYQKGTPMALVLLIFSILTMRALLFIGLLFIASQASAKLPSLLHDKPHHTFEFLDNLSTIDNCAYDCILKEDYEQRFAPDCRYLEGPAFGKCLCEQDAYRYIVDQCIGWSCGPSLRKMVRLTLDNALLTCRQEK